MGFMGSVPSQAGDRFIKGIPFENKPHLTSSAMFVRECYIKNEGKGQAPSTNENL